MSSRHAILQAIRQNRPAPSPLPEPLPPAPPPGDLAAHFARIVTDGGGQIVELSAGTPLAEALRVAYPDAREIAAAPGVSIDGTVHLAEITDPHGLAELDLLVCEGVLGVAENGAVWLPESRLVHRAAPFITQHLAIVLDRKSIVWDMAQAYARLKVAEEGFGVFVAGPSKTADIEQSLVIGAHGARSLTVLLTER